ncbi:MAG TPA: hypothetical protein VGG19_00815 [Tepidisphaeraceae bacterium]|jgi:hypothetical protein
MRRNTLFCAAGLGFCFLIGSVRAATISVVGSTISGVFSPETPALGAPAAYTSGSGSESIATFTYNSEQVILTFTPASFSTSVNVNGNAKNGITFGTFTVSGTNVSDFPIDNDFTLELDITSPNFGSGTTTATIDGSITSNKTGPNNSLDIVVNSFTIPSATEPNLAFAFNEISNLNDKGGDSQDLKGSISYTAAPLPAAAWGGISLIGILGAARLRRSGKTKQNIFQYL